MDDCRKINDLDYSNGKVPTVILNDILDLQLRTKEKVIEELILENALPKHLKKLSYFISDKRFNPTENFHRVLDNSEQTRINRAVLKGIQLKMKTIVDSGRDISLKDIVLHYAKTNTNLNTERYITLLYTTIGKLTGGFKFNVVSLYDDANILLYDIYRATEIIDFVCTYGYDLDIQGEIKSSLERNIYTDINYYIDKIPGLNTFVENLTDMQMFLVNYNRTNGSAYPKVLEELNNPGSLWINGYNRTIDAFNKNIKDTIKIEVFSVYSYEIYTSIITDDSLRVKTKLIADLAELIQNFYNPYKRSQIYDQVDEIYSIYYLGGLSDAVRNNPALIKRLGELNNMFRIGRLDIDQQTPPLNLNLTKDSTVQLFDKNANVSDFDFLTPESKDTVFFENELEFDSIYKYVIFTLLSGFLGIPSTEAYALVLDNVSLTALYVHKRDELFNDLLCKSAIAVLNEAFGDWRDMGTNMDRLMENNGNYLQYISANNFLGGRVNFVGKYIMYLLRARNLQNVIKNKIIIDWFSKKANDMINLVSYYNDILEGNIQCSQIIMILTFYYGYNLSDNSASVMHNLKVDDKFKCVLTYLSRFLQLFLETDYTEDDISALLTREKLPRQETVNMEQVYDIIDATASQLRAMLRLGNDVDQQFNAVMSYILGKRVDSFEDFQRELKTNQNVDSILRIENLALKL
jgi:hypothetical protein